VRQQIVLLVNGSPITDLDIARREKFLEMSNHKKPSRQEAINSLVDETLELKEAASYSLEVTDADVQSAYDNVAENMGVDAQKLTQILTNGGASADTLKHRLKAQIAWTTLVRGRFKVSLEIADKEVEAELQLHQPQDNALVGYEQSKTDAPGLKEVRDKMFEKEFGAKANRYLADLRRQAMIEYKSSATNGKSYNAGDAVSVFPENARSVIDQLMAAPSVTPITAGVPVADGLRGSAHPPETLSGKTSALTALQYAAEQGQPVAQWKLGRMYADGDGVPRDDVRAFNYFSQIANSHPDEAPGTPQARFVANAFVALGHYYLTGIPNSKIAADRARARDMFGYAATYFGDADAQYELGRLYLTGTPGDPHQAARWLQLAATKGHCRAEVALGDLLFQGQVVPRQAARGLMWLTLGRDCAGADETWVKPVYDNAFKRASDDERALALVFLEDWLKGRRD